MRKFKVHMNETLYYLSKEIEAENAEEATKKYVEMADNGNVEVNERDITELYAKEIIE